MGNFEDSVWHVEQYHYFNLNSVANFMLSNKVRDQGNKVVLTDEGSDEHFDRYIHFQQANYLLEPGLSVSDGIELLSDQERQKKLNIFNNQEEFKKYTKTDFIGHEDGTHRKLLNISLASL
ncbi:Histidine biosynthesis bifunctional protein hisB [Mucor velutinosus]|uniref:Histidine biosynthesis bifunctional protein hisB n=1 Tax=Mucor velutinosus TaxID=708070 RepID=A0AAN7DRL2_9FUNG|nr:Histidine biosynthesis bifunctional protein hisB [Mucor velutinosus]